MLVNHIGTHRRSRTLVGRPIRRFTGRTRPVRWLITGNFGLGRWNTTVQGMVTPMIDPAASGAEAWSSRVRAHEQAIQTGNSDALRAAREELLNRLETHGLTPAEAERLGQITMVLE